MNRTRTLVLAALLASLGPLVGNGLYAGPGAGGEAILAQARSGLPTVAYLAYTLEMVGFAALAVLFAWLVAFLIPRTPMAAVVTGIAGGAMVAVKMGSAAPIMAVHSMADSLDATTAETLVSLNDQAFVISAFLLSLAFLAAGTGLLATGFPRWLAWWATVAGGLGVFAGVVGIVQPQAFVPIPFLLLLLWMIATAITAVMRPDVFAWTRPNQTDLQAAVTE